VDLGAAAIILMSIGTLVLASKGPSITSSSSLGSGNWND
jgi:hypothetical protein